ncbi:MAG: hypothetical protein ACO1RT_15135, partial [Planctomycetaceae bacterium]
MATNLNTESSSSQGSRDEAASWEPVYSAISRRWPHILQQELRSCDCNVESLADLIANRTQGSREEIEAVIREFAPGGGTMHALGESATQVVQNVKRKVSETAHQLNETAHSLYERAEDGMSECPMRTASTAFFTGLVTGIL